MRRYLLAAVLFCLFFVVGCALPGWEPPKQPYVDLQGSSDDYTQSKWVGRGSR